MIAGGIEYLAAGDGSPVICLHGVGGAAESFRPQLAGLPGHRVIAWNMPGYGASKAFAAAYSFAALSDALSSLIAELGLSAVHLVGHSIGGMIALDYALGHPAQATTLTLIGTTPRFGGRDESFKDAFLKARLGPLDAGQNMADMAAGSAPGLVGPDASAALIAEVATAMSHVLEPTWRGILAALVTFDRFGDLGRLSLPTCVIAGSHDRNAPPGTMREMADRIRGAEFHEIDRAGHMINLEAPDQVNAIISGFLGDHAP